MNDWASVSSVCISDVSVTIDLDVLLEESDSTKDKTASRSSPKRKSVMCPAISQICVLFYYGHLIFFNILQEIIKDRSSISFQMYDYGDSQY